MVWPFTSWNPFPNPLSEAPFWENVSYSPGANAAARLANWNRLPLLTDRFMDCRTLDYSLLGIAGGAALSPLLPPLGNSILLHSSFGLLASRGRCELDQAGLETALRKPQASLEKNPFHPWEGPLLRENVI